MSSASQNSAIKLQGARPSTFSDGRNLKVRTFTVESRETKGRGLVTAGRPPSRFPFDHDFEAAEADRVEDANREARRVAQAIKAMAAQVEESARLLKSAPE